MRRPLARTIVLGTSLQGGLVAAGLLLPGLLEAGFAPFAATALAAATGFFYGVWDRGSTPASAAGRAALAAAASAALAAAAGFLLGQGAPSTIGVAAGTAAVASLPGLLLARLGRGREPRP